MSVYLKLRGIDPAKHDVTVELDRIKKYYAKIKDVEDPARASNVSQAPVQVCLRQNASTK